MSCPICGFEPEDPEEFENHFRWVHVSRRDFGPEPIPTIMTAMMAGYLSSDEMARFVEEIVNESFEKAWNPRVVFPATGVGVCAGVMFGIGMNALFPGWPVVGFEAGIALGASLSILRSVRQAKHRVGDKDRGGGQGDQARDQLLGGAHLGDDGDELG